nr:hypothetical protein [Paenibacillus polymyxa]
MDAIRRVVGAIMDNLLYSPKLFEIAENPTCTRKTCGCIVAVNEGVAEAEKISNILNAWQSVNIAYSRFKLENDQSRNIRAAAVFEAFVERLDESDQLDALKDLANVYRSFA